jgi:hypothetical protein
MEHTDPNSATEDEERTEAEGPHDADRAATPDEERLAEEARERYADEAESVAEHERSMNETGANEKGEGRVP